MVSSDKMSLSLKYCGIGLKVPVYLGSLFSCLFPFFGLLLTLICFHGSCVLFDDHFLFSISPSRWHFSAICFLFSPSPALFFSPISLCRACSPPFTLSLTFRGTWWKSNCPTELVGLLSYLHHAIVCVVMFASSLTSAVWLCSQPLRPHVSKRLPCLGLPSTLGHQAKPVMAMKSQTNVNCA